METKLGLLTAALLLLGSAGDAVAQEVPYGKVAKWQILSINQKGQFHRCTASMTDRDGMIRIHSLRNGAWTLSWPRGDLPKKSKAEGDFDFGRASFRFQAESDEGSRASTGLDAGMVGALRGAKAVSINVGRNHYSWTMDDVPAAMDAVSKCRDTNVRAVAVGGSTAAGMIYPDYPGASQSCVIPRGVKWSDGTPLVLDNCPRGNAKVFVRSGGGIVSAAKKNLCVGVAGGAKRGIVALQKCSEAATKWSITATSTKATRVTSAEGECWAIPALADGNARFPFEIEAAVCGDRRTKPVNFFFEGG